MGRDHQGHALVLEGREGLIQVKAQWRIQTCMGFVQHQQGRAHRQGPGQSQALGHAAGKVRWPQVQSLQGEAGPPGRYCGPFPPVGGFADLQRRQGRLDHVPARAMGRQPGLGFLEEPLDAGAA